MRIVRQTAGSREFRPAATITSSRSFSPVTALSPGQRLPALDPNPAGNLCERLLDEAALIERVNRGDQRAAQFLVESLRPTILKCLRRPLPRWANEDDLVQTVLGKVFVKLHQFSGSVPLEHWVSRIAINASLSQIAHESVRPEVRMSDLSEEQEAALQNASAPHTASEEANDAREVLQLLLAQLKPEERIIVVLLHIEQRTTREISQMTGLSISAIKVKAYRTRHKMRRLGKRILRDSRPQAALFRSR